MNAQIMMDLPSAAEAAIGTRVVVCSGPLAGVWECFERRYPSQWTGSYTAGREWRGVHTPEAHALAEAFDLAATARYWAGQTGSRRMAYPGPSKAADAALEAAIKDRTGEVLPPPVNNQWWNASAA